MAAAAAAAPGGDSPTWEQWWNRVAKLNAKKYFDIKADVFESESTKAKCLDWYTAAVFFSGQNTDAKLKRNGYYLVLDDGNEVDVGDAERKTVDNYYVSSSYSLDCFGNDFEKVFVYHFKDMIDTILGSVGEDDDLAELLGSLHFCRK